jgi:hypothetical protein
MLPQLRTIILVLVALVAAPVIAHAQQTGSTRTELSAGPRRDVTATAVRQLMQPVDSAALLQRARRQSSGKPAALMIVGGAAVVLGAVIGDAPGTLFMIGGAAAFLYGLYLYLQ